MKRYTNNTWKNTLIIYKWIDRETYRETQGGIYRIVISRL